MIKIKKMITLIGLLLVLSGCTVDYTVVISENNIKENIYVVDNVLENRNKDDIKNFYNLWYPVYNEDMIIESYNEKYDDVSYYNKSELNDIGNGYIYSYQYNHDINDYKNSMIWNYAFDNKSIIENNKRILISTSKGLNFFRDNTVLSSIKINIKTDYVVQNNNADIVNDGIYTWEFTKDNYMNKNIYIDIDKTKKISDEEEIITDPVEEEPEDKSSDFSLYYICGGLALFVIVLIILFKLKKHFR